MTVKQASGLYAPDGSSYVTLVDGAGNLAPATGGTVSENITQIGGTNVSTGTGASGAGIMRVTVANDSNVLTTQSGTWTVQPGNTANTTAWKVDGSAVTQPVSGTFFQATQPVSAASLPLPTNAMQQTGGTVGLVAGSAIVGKVTTDQTTPGTTDLVHAAQQGTWTVQPGNTPNTTAWIVKDQRSSTGTQTSVASSATDVTVLASNANRLGATVYNDSTQILYLLLASGTSSNSNYTVQLASQTYYEVPFNYTGVLKGLWASANGNARVTELS